MKVRHPLLGSVRVTVNQVGRVRKLDAARAQQLVGRTDVLDAQVEPGFSCALRSSRVPPQSKNASEPKVYRCGKPSVVPYQASDSLMFRTVREIWASGPSVRVVMIGLSCRRRALVPGTRNQRRSACRFASPSFATAFAT